MATEKERQEQPVAVALKDVVKEYESAGIKIRPVNGINLEVGMGQMAAIVGPSGSGKTTLLNLVGALHRPTSGTVYIDGSDISKYDDKQLTMLRRNKVGFVFQTFNLIPNLSALENVMLPMEFAQVETNERKLGARDLLRLVGMEHRASHKPGMLSGGEQQRVAIARALANDPPIILADEPTGNLDYQTGEQIIELLKNLAHDKNKTVIVVTHWQELQKIADTVYTIRDGKIMAQEARRE